MAQPYIQDPYRLIGTTLSDEYRLEAYAGGGGLGAVYCATQVSSGQQVAIKILKPDVVIRNPEYLDLFEREVKAVQNLDHPNIVKLFDSGSDQGISYMVMEWLEGQTLEELLSEEQLSVDRATHLFRQVCDAFAAAHKIKIIHLDVKPANIFLLKDGSPQGSVKVIDFGMSRILTRESGTTVTRFLGTYQYCSPEHFGGKVSSRSDIYSLGVTLYHMITGTIPFGTSYINAKRHRNLEMPPVPSVRGIRPDFPSTVDRVIEKALRKLPSERQQSVEEVFDEFYKAVYGTSADCIQTLPLGERIETRQTAGLRVLSAPRMATTGFFIGALLLSILGPLAYTQLYQKSNANRPDIPAVAQTNQPQEAHPAPSVTPPVTERPGAETSPPRAPSAPATKPGALLDKDLVTVSNADAGTKSDQVGEHITCRRDGQTWKLTPDKGRIFATSFASSNVEMQKFFDEVARHTELRMNIYMVPVLDNINVEICPGDSGGRNYIVYSAAWLQDIYRETNNTWVLYAILAHEIGHYALAHDRTSLGSNARIELEADEYAGQILASMGASLADAQAAYRSKFIASPDSHTHPPVNQRLNAVLRGWGRIWEASPEAMLQK